MIIRKHMYEDKVVIVDEIHKGNGIIIGISGLFYTSPFEIIGVDEL